MELSLNQSRAEPTANLLPNGMVLIAGGSGVYVLDTAELYDPVSGVFTTKSVLLNVPRAYSSETTLPDGSVLVAGGISFVSSPYSSAELYVPATGKFAYTGSLNSARYEHTATLLNNGTVLLVGGFESWDTPIGPVLGSAELFDPTTGTFSLTGSLITPRANHAATLLANGEVLITGGQGSAGDLSIRSDDGDIFRCWEHDVHAVLAYINAAQQRPSADCRRRRYTSKSDYASEFSEYGGAV